MPRCEDWEWGVIPCDCQLKDCLLDVNKVAFEASVAILNAQQQGELSPSEAARQIEGIHDWQETSNEACLQASDICKGKPPRPPYFESSDKGDFSSHATGSTTASAASLFTAAVLMRAPAQFGLGGLAGSAMFMVGVGYGAAAIGFLIVARRLKDLTGGAPPDPEWETIVQPAPPSPPELTASADHLTPALAAAFNQMLENQTMSIGLAGALATSLDRASAAENAGNIVARDHQITAARDFARQWARELERSGDLRAAVATKMEGYAGMRPAVITDILSTRDEVLSNGWPQRINEIVESYTDQHAERERLQRQMNQGLGHLAALMGGPVDTIEARHLIPLDGEVAETLDRFSTT